MTFLYQLDQIHKEYAFFHRLNTQNLLGIYFVTRKTMWSGGNLGGIRGYRLTVYVNSKGRDPEYWCLAIFLKIDFRCG